jgi:hypothetical protein
MARTCSNCRGEISDLSTHPYARKCLACRYLNRIKPVTTKYCRLCGNEITDIIDHKKATLCPKCRVQYKGPTHDTASKFLQAVRDHLNKRAWPTFVCTTQTIDDWPELMATLEASDRTRALWRLSVCLKKIVGPRGERYVLWSKTSNTYVLDTSPDDRETCLQEATA